MAAYEKLNSFQSGRYVRLHRGFAGMHHDKVDSTQLGHHWVGDSDSHVADRFAEQLLYDTYDDDSSGKGTVLVGLVHKRHILKPGSPEWEENINEGHGADQSENEIPLAPGTPVHIVQATNINRTGGDTDHEFTPRRRGRA
jgi:hypothetical protein